MTEWLNTKIYLAVFDSVPRASHPQAQVSSALATVGGASGIIIDNDLSTPTGASQTYFSTLSNQACTGNGTTGSGTGGCAIQASQANLQ